MKTRYFISAKEAQQILYTQENTSLFDYFFSDAYDEMKEAAEDGVAMAVDITPDEVIEQTEWSIIEEDGEYKLDWKNSIMGLGTHYWGHEPMTLEKNTGFLRFPLYECAKEIED